MTLATTNNISVVLWKDTKVVLFASNAYSIHPTSNVSRVAKINSKKRRFNVECPKLVSIHNLFGLIKIYMPRESILGVVSIACFWYRCFVPKCVEFIQKYHRKKKSRIANIDAKFFNTSWKIMELLPK